MNTLSIFPKDVVISTESVCIQEYLSNTNRNEFPITKKYVDWIFSTRQSRHDGKNMYLLVSKDGTQQTAGEYACNISWLIKKERFEK